MKVKPTFGSSLREDSRRAGRCREGVEVEVNDIAPFRRGLHKTFTRSELYKHRSDPIPYVATAAKTRPTACLGSMPPLPEPEFPRTEKAAPRLDGLEEESDI